MTEPNYTGVAELPGDDFIVATGVFLDLRIPLTFFNVGGPFMHELGHNLGLSHYGDKAAPLFVPNYFSVMGQYVFRGILSADTPGSIIPNPTLTRLDYSNAVLPTLDELHLDETRGISSGTNDIAFFSDALGLDGFGAGTGPVDWSGDGFLDSDVSVSINFDFCPPGV